LSRRALLAAGLQLGALSILAACAQSAPAVPSKPAAREPVQPSPAIQAEAARPTAPGQVGLLKAPEPNPKRGGVARLGGFGDPAHFDLDQSPSIVNLWPQAPMYDNLVRFNPLDGGRTIIPDLAERWVVSPDGSSYTFSLRRGVQFHDGTDLTADDVVATFKRRMAPPQGVVSIRQELFRAVDAIEAPDPYTVRFVMREPRAFFLEALATSWSIVLSKKALEANNGDLRRVPDYPGTGPYRALELKPREKWVLERNSAYWNRELPYVDQLERISMLQDKDRGTAVLTGQVDFSDGVSVDTYLEALKRPQEVEARLNPATWAFTVTFNTTRPPFNDPRVRRAVHLAIDRQALAKAFELVANIDVGTRWCHPGSVLAGQREEILTLPGYRAAKDADLVEARQLMAAAGYENGLKDLIYLHRGLSGPELEIYAAAFQDMLRRQLKLDATIRPVETSLYWDQVRAGDYHLTYGVPAGSINDPSDYWSQWFKTNGPQNYARWSNARFDALLARIDRELEPERRRPLVREAEDLLDQEVPMFFHGWANVARIWRKYVKGLNHDVVGSYMVVRYDTLWLDR
jgi:ABC-type transport system substrate-binding protein